MLHRQDRNITTQERKVCDVDIEIVLFAVNENVQLTIPTDRDKQSK